MSRILCFGDSITYGAWDTRGGWVARLRQRVDQVCVDSSLKTFCLTYNLGVSSDTTEQLLGRFEAETAARSYESGASAFIFSIGTNDSVWLREEKRYWVELSEFERNLSRLIKMAQVRSSDILFLGNLPVDELKTQPYSSDANLSSSNSDIRAYDQATAEQCRKAGVPFIEVFEQAQKMGVGRLLYDDGIHPCDAGHEFLAGLVWDEVSRLKWLDRP